MNVGSHNFESDSGEQASTNDDVESSQQWTTDFDDDSDTEEEENADDLNTAENSQHHYHHRLHRHHHHRHRHRQHSDNDTDHSDSNDGEMDYDDSEDGDTSAASVKKKKSLSAASGTYNNGAAGNNGERRQLVRGATSTTIVSGKKALNARGTDSTQVQSDTETRNLLDDVGDFDDDCLDLQETFTNPADTLYNASDSPIDPSLFELSDEQYDYYSNCFMYLLATTQGHVQVDGALNGADTRIIDFFRKSRLDNCTLSRVWALSDVNEDGFLNITEFVVAMHIVVLHLKAGVPIPTRLPSVIRPPVTPVRQLIRVANGNLGTIPAYFSQPGGDGVHPTGDDLCGSTTTTSAASSSNSATNFAASMLASDGASSRGSNHSKSQPHCYQNSLATTMHQFGGAGQLVPSSTMSTSLDLNNSVTDVHNGGYEIVVNPHVSSNCAGIKSANAYATYSADFADAAGGSSNGVKQHSLSDDHLHLYAQQRDIGMANFSDVPPVLVDSHPTALNALNTPLTLLSGAASSRGPPPQPPPRDYAAPGGSKGHGRSASLDLKTFSALSPSYTPKSIHSNHRFPQRSVDNDDTATQKSFPQHLETLSEDLNQYTRQLSGSAHVQQEQATQTDHFEFPAVNALTSEFEDIFSTSDLYEHLSTSARCELLKRLNDELEGERLKLAQIRLQLQLRIEEVEQELSSLTIPLHQQHQQPQKTTMNNANSIRTMGYKF